MGGDTDNNSMTVFHSGEEDSSIDQEFSNISSSFLRDDGLSMKSESFRHSLDLEAKHRRRDTDLREILRSHANLGIRSQGFEQAKAKILSYKPGAWIEKSGNSKSSDYDIPATTSILLVGPKGAGKSSLVNRISKVFEDDKFASERAQVTYTSSVGDGTLFLKEYMIPRGSMSFCLYDTRGLSENSSENAEMLKQWMTRGVRDGQPVTRDSDDQSLKSRIKCKARNNGRVSDETRKVNYVVVVVNGLTVLESLDNDNEDTNRLYGEVIASAFNSPYVSFRDDKPLVVITHGDLLSQFDRARVRVHLGELLGIPPTKQIFDIPEKLDPETELTIVDMLRYSLEHADKNLPRRCSSNWKKNEDISLLLASIILALPVVGISIFTLSLLDGDGPAKSTKPWEKDDIIQVHAQFSKPWEKDDTQGQAKPSSPRAKDDVQGPANSPRPRGKDGIQGLKRYPKAEADDDTQRRAKFAKTRPKEKGKVQWHEIRHLWLATRHNHSTLCVRTYMCTSTSDMFSLSIHRT